VRCHRVAPTGAKETRDRHALYFLDLAEQTEVLLSRHGGLDWLDRLDVEHDNFRAALEFLLGRTDDVAIEQAQRLAGALTSFWWMRGYLDEGLRWLSRALAGSARSAARMKALHRAAWLAHIQRDSIARALLEESLEIANALEGRIPLDAVRERNTRLDADCQAVGRDPRTLGRMLLRYGQPGPRIDGNRRKPSRTWLDATATRESASSSSRTHLSAASGPRS
jgi:hypothetical protein